LSFTCLQFHLEILLNILIAEFATPHEAMEISEELAKEEFVVVG
jgi:hypothetical protein